jgi:hypothetical protein
MSNRRRTGARGGLNSIVSRSHCDCVFSVVASKMRRKKKQKKKRRKERNKKCQANVHRVGECCSQYEQEEQYFDLAVPHVSVERAVEKNDR